MAATEADTTVDEVAARFGVHPTRIHDRKEKLVAGAVVAGTAETTTTATDTHQAEVADHPGRLTVEPDGVKERAAAFR